MNQQKRPNLARRIIAEMTGKVGNFETNGFWLGVQRIFNRGISTAINYERNNYDLFDSIYFNSVINKKGEEYQVAAALGKPLINITAGYVVGRGVQVELENPNSQQIIQDAEDDINDWLKRNQTSVYNTARYGYRRGDAYIHVDEFGSITELDPRGVQVVTDPVSGELMGYDVRLVVDINQNMPGQENSTPETWVYVKQYRRDSTRIYRFPDGQPESFEILWEKVFTDDGAVDTGDVMEFDDAGKEVGIPRSLITERKLPIKHFANEPEAQAIYGNSDYQNLLALFRDYAAVIKEAKKSVIYNASPLPVLKGVINPNRMEADPAVGSDGNKVDGEGFKWGQDKIIYLNGEGADAKMLQGVGVMEDVSKLLEIYFYLFVQGAETPEFALGTAVSSSKASTETQMPIFAKKVERKQAEFTKFLIELVETYIEKQLLISNPTFLAIQGELPDVRINFPPIDDEDKAMTLELVTYAFESKFITALTALELILGDKIKNASEELKKAADEAKKAAQDAEPAQQDRLVKTLLDNAAKTAQATPTTPEPAPVEE